MKFWIQDKLSQLESYFYVEKELKRRIDIWCAVYSAFICSYLLFIVEYDSFSKLISIIVLIIIGLLGFFTGSFFNRLRLLIIFILVNPLLISLIYPIEDRFIRLVIILFLFFITLLSSNRAIFKVGKLVLICNGIFCVILVYSYYQTVYTYKVGPPPIEKLIDDNDINKDIYVIILDGFPSKKVLKDYYNTNSKLLDYFETSSFIEKKPLSKYTDTYNSLPNIFSGAIFPNESKFHKKDITKLSGLLPGNYLKNYASINNHKLSFTSFFIDQNSNALNYTFGRGADFSIYMFSLIERFILYINPNVKFGRNKEIENITNQNIKLLQHTFLDKGKVLSVNHFLTFHTNPNYDSKIKSSVLMNLDYADEIGLFVIKTIENKKTDAKIIVLSDHGVKGDEIRLQDHYQSILYIKN